VNLKVTLHGFPQRTRELTLADGATGYDMLKALNISPELVLVFRNRTPMPLDDTLHAEDDLTVLRIVSGG